jgi:RNA polymerase sigma-70 factor
MKLLVATPESGPRLGEYTGRGSLLSWVRVTAVRTALKLRADEKPAPPEDPDALLKEMRAPGHGPEGTLIQQRHQADFRHATREAFSTLSPEERHLLRLYFVDKLSMYEVAALFRVHEATISRRLKDVRQRIYKETQRHLQARLGLAPRDFSSFLRVLDSQLDLSISQLMGEEDAVPRPPGRD